MNILMLSVNFEKWVANTLFCEQQAIIDQAAERGDTVIMYGPGFRYTHTNLPDIIKEFEAEDISFDSIVCYVSPLDLLKGLPEAIVKEFNLSEKMRHFPMDLDKITTTPKVFWMNDFWQLSQKKWDRVLLENGFDAVFSVYSPFHVTNDIFNQTFSKSVQKHIQFFPLPRAIDLNFYPTDQKHDRDIDVTLLGANSQEMYPSRYYFSETLKRQTGLKICQTDHPGYSFINDDSGEKIVGRKYRETLSRSKIFVTCGLKYNLPVIKIYEILASGALLVTDRINNAEVLGLESGKHYIETTLPDFMSTVKHYLSDEQNRATIALAGQNVLRKHHNTTVRAQEFLSLIEKVITGPRLSVKTKQTQPESPLKTNFSKLKLKINKRFQKLKGTRKRSKASVFLKPSPFSQLDWKNIIANVHVLDTGLRLCKDDFELFHQFGLNSYDGSDKRAPNITEYPELIMHRPFILRDLLSFNVATTCAEVGTARGMQSLVWARQFEKEGKEDGRIYTCDIVDHDRSSFQIPGEGEKLFARNELFTPIPDEIKSRINFVDGDVSALVSKLKRDNRKIDVAYIDGAHDYTNVITDFETLESHFNEKTIVVFDDVDARFPGSERAISEILHKKGLKACAVSFSPSFYRIILASDAETIQRVSKKLNATVFDC